MGLNLWRTGIAVARNQVKRVSGGATRGGHRTTAWSAEARETHAREIYQLLAPYVGPVVGKTGLEIGPGDNLDACRLFVAAGATRMLAVERFSHPTDVPAGITLVASEIEQLDVPPESIDFIYSHDVFEHVRDVPAAFHAIARALKAGGRAVHSVDLRGHNSFNNAVRPLEHLTCPDWLYSLMHSHIVTSNRIRVVDLRKAAEMAGLVVDECRPLAVADGDYVRSLRERLLPRWRELPTDDLATLQVLISCHK
jgi:SAM-dependent methyltransferase